MGSSQGERLRGSPRSSSPFVDHHIGSNVDSFGHVAAVKVVSFLCGFASFGLASGKYYNY